MPYTRPYTAGFVDFPLTSTPINSTALNTMDVGIKTANDQFQSVTTTERNAITSPVVGQCVWDSTLRQLMVYMNATTGNAWQPIGNSIVCASTTRPVTPFEGQEIYETDSNKTLVYNGAAWVETGDLDNTGGLADASLAQVVRVFTNEAARDAAITSPTKGMHAYLTAPTVPTNTANAQTIYNGSVWVCVTPQSASVATRETTSSTSFTSLSTSGPAVTLVTGTTALVTVSVQLDTNLSGTYAEAAVAVSGATTIAATAANGVIYGLGNANSNASCSSTFLISSLTAGTNTFTLQYKTSANTMGAQHRKVTVQGVA